jgi:hypothetical protein
MVIHSSPIPIPFPIRALPVAVYLVQLLFVQHFVIDQGHLKICLVLTIFLGGCISLLYLLYQKVATSPHFVMSWMPLLAMISLRYLHALSVGGDVFAKRYGPSSFFRVVIFTLSVPPVVFNDTFLLLVVIQTPDSGHKELKMCLSELFGTAGMSYRVLQLDLDKILAFLAQEIVYVYILSLATAVPRMIFEIPIKILLDDRVEILPLTDMPYLVRSPHDLWHGWSTSVGYQLRMGFYEPLGGSNKPIALLVSFLSTLGCVYMYGPL